MATKYFNHTIHVAEDRWERQRFLRAWWRIYGADARWAPPFFPIIRDLLGVRSRPHLERLQPQLIHLEALPSRQRANNGGGAFSGVLFEEPVAATVLLTDDRRGSPTAYLGEFHIANDPETFERFLSLLAEQLWRSGVRRLVGPVGISPVLRSGVLMNHFDVTPPLHTAYNPPYVPELVGMEMEPLDTRHLFVLDVPEDTPVPAGPAHLSWTGIRHDGGRLLPLLAHSCDWSTAFPRPDPDELRFVMRWLSGHAPVHALVAKEHGKLVGIVLLQADQASRLCRAGGGRNLLWRWWFRWRRRFPVRRGRVLLGGVAVEARGRGIGTQLWAGVLDASRRAGWSTLTIGPLAKECESTAVIESWGAVPRQQYTVFSTEL